MKARTATSPVTEPVRTNNISKQSGGVSTDGETQATSPHCWAHRLTHVLYGDDQRSAVAYCQLRDAVGPKLQLRSGGAQLRKVH